MDEVFVAAVDEVAAGEADTGTITSNKLHLSKGQQHPRWGLSLVDQVSCPA